MFIISTKYKTVEIRDAVKAAEILKGLVERLPAHQDVEVALWAADWRGYQEVLYFSKLEADDVGNVPPYPGSYKRGFRSVWKA